MNRLDPRGVLIGFVLLLSGGASAVGRESNSNVSLEDLKREIGEFGEIDHGIYRGAQPTEEGLRLLKAFGVKTVVNFRHEKGEIEWEREKAEELGLRYVSLPWRIQYHPKTNVMEVFLKLVERKEEGPFFLHCRRGSERTGVADAVYRHHSQKLSFEEAYRRATEGYRILFYWKPFMKARYRQFVEGLAKSAEFS